MCIYLSCRKRRALVPWVDCSMVQSKTLCGKAEHDTEFQPSLTWTYFNLTRSCSIWCVHCKLWKSWFYCKAARLVDIGPIGCLADVKDARDVTMTRGKPRYLFNMCTNGEIYLIKCVIMDEEIWGNWNSGSSLHMNYSEEENIEGRVIYAKIEDVSVEDSGCAIETNAMLPNSVTFDWDAVATGYQRIHTLQTLLFTRCRASS